MLPVWWVGEIPQVDFEFLEPEIIPVARGVGQCAVDDVQKFSTHRHQELFGCAKLMRGLIDTETKL